MENTAFYIVCSAIILLGSVVTSIATIYNVAKAPAKKIKAKQDAELKKTITDTITEIMPGLFLKHDLETKEKYKADRERYLHEISNEVMEQTLEVFEKRLKNLDNMPLFIKTVEELSVTAKDVLRDKIMTIYLDNRTKKSMSTVERERLTQFYIDYKALNGNSYIDKYYKRMEKWKTLDDVDTEDDII
jgi:vacuolar-type H+-ATPase subunit E/Vma4